MGPDLTELMFFTDGTSPSVQEASWNRLSRLSANARPYRCEAFWMARLTPEEVEELESAYPDVPRSVNQIIAGQEYPPPPGYHDTIPELATRMLPEWHRGGVTCSWPSLVGHHFEVAKEIILAQNPKMTVIDCGQACMQTCDYIPMRVRIYTSHKNIVTSVPSSG